MQRFIICLLCSGTLFSLSGCGGLTQEDMRRHAIKRPNDDEDEPSVSAPATNDAGKSLRQDQPADKGTEPDAAAATFAPASDPAADADLTDSSVEQASLPKLPRVSPPAEPLQLEERRERTIDNMRKIGAAINKHIADKHTMPPAAILSSSGRPLLSWRVELLPYLGYEDLYKQFRLEEPWDSPHNQLLLPFIPKEYQSPERFDEKTNYLAPVASFAAFQGTRGLGIRKIEDGLENTIVVLEADDQQAVPWTKPKDLELNLYRFNTKVGNLRQDGFFVVWGTGVVTRIRPDASDAELRAAFTVDAGEPISSFAIRADATSEPALEELMEEDDTEETEDAAPTTRVASGKKAEPAAVTEVEPAKWPVPDESTMNEAKRLYREIYEDEYNAAKTLKEKEKFARKLMDEANRMKEDYAGRYVLLEIIVKVAAQAGDAKTTLDAADQLTADYEVDEIAVKQPALETLMKTDDSGNGANDILEAATPLIDLAVERDDYESAESLCAIAIAAARKNNDRRKALQMEKRKYQVRDAKKAFAAVRRIVESLKGEDDPKANLEVGRYYCLVKADWDRGLPLLARCSDATLRDLAEQEMRKPTIPADQLKLADGWWTLAEKKASHEKALQLRAAYWYMQARQELPHGLHRVKAEMRVKETEDKYGKQEVAELLAAG